MNVKRYYKNVGIIIGTTRKIKRMQTIILIIVYLLSFFLVNGRESGKDIKKKMPANIIVTVWRHHPLSDQIFLNTILTSFNNVFFLFSYLIYSLFYFLLFFFFFHYSFFLLLRFPRQGWFIMTLDQNGDWKIMLRQNIKRERPVIKTFLQSPGFNQLYKPVYWLKFKDSNFIRGI